MGKQANYQPHNKNPHRVLVSQAHNSRRPIPSTSHYPRADQSQARISLIRTPQTRSIASGTRHLHVQSQIAQYGVYTRYASLMRLSSYHSIAIRVANTRYQTTQLSSRAFSHPPSQTHFSTSSQPSSVSRARCRRTSHPSSTSSSRNPMSPLSSRCWPYSSSRSRYWT